MLQICITFVLEKNILNINFLFLEKYKIGILNESNKFVLLVARKKKLLIHQVHWKFLSKNKIKVFNTLPPPPTYLFEHYPFVIC